MGGKGESMSSGESDGMIVDEMWVGEKKDSNPRKSARSQPDPFATVSLSTRHPALTKVITLPQQQPSMKALAGQVQSMFKSGR